MNKKLLIGLGGLAACGIGLCTFLAKKEPTKYSLEWIKKLTDSQWETERELVRQKFCSPEYDTDLRVRFKTILDLFDKVKSDRDWAGKTPTGPTFHREHGWYI